MSKQYRWNQLQLDIVYGRNFLLSEMLQALPSPNGNSFGLTAARRMGKTTVLRLIERDLKNGASVYLESGTAISVIYIDGLTLPRPLSAQMLWGRIIFEIRQKFDSLVVNAEHPIDFFDFVRECDLLFSRQEKLPKAIIIFDEIEHIVVNETWAASFFANWRALLSNYPSLSGQVCAVFSGAREMANLQHDIGSPLMDVLEWRSLRSLDERDTELLITEPSGITVDKDIVEYILDETGGHPMILQYVMQKSMLQSPSPTKENFQKSISDFEKNRVWQFGEWWSKYCDPASQLIYLALPTDHSYKSITTFSAEVGGYEASKSFEILQHIGIAEISEDSNNIRRRCRMFTRWAGIFAVPATGTAFDASLAYLLDALNPSYREKYISAWAIYNQVMPNYSGAVSEMRDLVTLVLHKLAPDEPIIQQENFKYERDQTKPTRRQRVMYIFGATSREQGKAVASEDELLEAHASNLASVLSKSYANASALTHTTASRPLAYTAIKQAESILAQLTTR